MPETQKTTAEKILEAGVKSTSTDGNTTVFVEPADLLKQVRRQTGGNRRRPVVATIKCGSM